MSKESNPFASSALVVAHPDDEVLWFSSVLGRVGKVIVAFEACADLPLLEAARRAVRERYPLKTVTFLRRPEPCSLPWVDWRAPAQTRFGMALNRPGAEAAAAARRYRTSYGDLRADLARALTGVKQVFTHNPWGEYGHPDHVQVSRVIENLEADLGFRALYSCYVAPRSLGLAQEYFPRMRAEHTFATDRALATRIKQLYFMHGAWTWHAAYEPPQAESFLVMTSNPLTEADVLPLQYLPTT